MFLQLWNARRGVLFQPRAKRRLCLSSRGSVFTSPARHPLSSLAPLTLLFDESEKCSRDMNQTLHAYAKRRFLTDSLHGTLAMSQNCVVAKDKLKRLEKPHVNGELHHRTFHTCFQVQFARPKDGLVKEYLFRLLQGK